MKSNLSPTSTRRSFLKTSTAVGAGVATFLSAAPGVYAGGSDVIRVGLIGCGSSRGGRGRGAALNCLNAGPGVKLVALADVFRDHLEFSLDYMKKQAPDNVDVASDRCFVGFDAYQKLVDCKDVDLVLLASPPGFRPQHIQAAVAAGKHIFCEKPVAVDAPGVRAVLRACEEAKSKNLSLVSGLCYRYDYPRRELFRRVHDGAIGDIIALQCNYNTGGLWNVPRQPGWSDMEWQLRNWLYFTWLSGDHNVEQHIHSLDVMAWAMKDEYPVKCMGVGGRQVRTSPDFGHIFDHHSVVYEYKNGLRCFSQCRQQNGAANDVSDWVFGSKGTADVFKQTIVAGARRTKLKLPPGLKDDGMYQNEHNELIASIRAGKPINNGDYMSKSTLMAIMGRMATYTGQVITWEMAMNSQENLMPAKLEFGPLATPQVARPGVTKFV